MEHYQLCHVPFTSLRRDAHRLPVLFDEDPAQDLARGGVGIASTNLTGTDGSFGDNGWFIDDVRFYRYI